MRSIGNTLVLWLASKVLWDWALVLWPLILFLSRWCQKWINCLVAWGTPLLPHWSWYQIINIVILALVIKNLSANAGDIEMWVRSLGQEDPLEEGMATTPKFLPGETLFLPGKSHGHRSLAGYSPWGHKESDMTEWLTLSLFSLFLLHSVGAQLGKHWIKTLSCPSGVCLQHYFHSVCGANNLSVWGGFVPTDSSVLPGTHEILLQDGFLR